MNKWREYIWNTSEISVINYNIIFKIKFSKFDSALYRSLCVSRPFNLAINLSPDTIQYRFTAIFTGRKQWTSRLIRNGGRANSLDRQNSLSLNTRRSPRRPCVDTRNKFARLPRDRTTSGTLCSRPRYLSCRSLPTSWNIG